ncbi:inovirus-type Gp2 protein [Acinetobacter baumannii]
MNDNNIHHPKIKETEVKDSFDPIPSLSVQIETDLLDESEEVLSEYDDEINEQFELEDLLNSESGSKHYELPIPQTLNQFLNHLIDPNVAACTIAINLCDEIIKQQATSLYSLYQPKNKEDIPLFNQKHWELTHPRINQLLRSFLLNSKRTAVWVNIKCEQLEAVMAALDKALKPYLDFIYDLIEHPYEELNEVDANGRLTGHKVSLAVILNRFIKVLFEQLHSPEYVQRVNDRRKVAKRGEKKVQKYIDKLRGLYSRLLGVRVDLYLPSDKKHFTPQQIVKHFHTILQKLRRSKSLHLKGYVSKMEYGVDQALHIHCFFFFCGRKHREDISLGRMIGELWDSQIGGKHSYFNCNTSKNRKKYKYDALGVIDRDDQTKYDNIAKVIRYFAKFEQYVLHSSLERIKTLNTGLLPHIKKGMGRPNLTQYYTSI